MLARWVDPDTGAVAQSADGEPLEACRAIAPAADLCALGNLDPPLSFFGVPPRRLRLELALWTPQAVSAERCTEVLRAEDCDAGEACAERPLFDLRGVPRASFRPQPAFAGAVYVDAESQDEVTVALTCSDPLQVDAPSCQVSRTAIAASVTDLATLLPATAAEAGALAVAAAEPLTLVTDGGQVETIIDADSVVPLALESVAPPTYTATAERAFGAVVCAQVLELGPEATASVHCQRAAATPGGALELEGLRVDAELLDAALAALGHASVPARGLVIGRVVDATSQPVAGAVVSPEAGTVVYLDASLAPAGSAETSASGYFVSDDIPFDTPISANANGASASARAGLVTGRVTAVILRLEDELSGP